jgi:outer membrane phospholipase A
MSFSLLCFLTLAQPKASQEDNEIITMDRNYFSIGSKNEPTKGELGFAYQLFDQGSLFVGYNHKTLWLIREPSAPVLDSNYNPSLFYYLGNFDEWAINLGILDHVSNGESGLNSRGVNMSYLHVKKTYSFKKIYIDIAAKVYYSYKISDSNTDIVDYTGIWKGLIRFREFLPFIKPQHSLEFRISPGGSLGTDFSSGNIEIGVKIKPTSNSRFDFYCQYFNGRNEYLLNYRQYQNVLRVGLSFEL